METNILSTSFDWKQTLTAEVSRTETEPQNRRTPDIERTRADPKLK